MEKDYYNILGISDEEKKLSGKEFEKLIKSKYRKLAMKYHPDKQQGNSDEEKKAAENKFKKVSEAYETLSKEDKRAEYDARLNGFAGEDVFGGFGGFDDILRGFGFSDMGMHGRREERNVKGQSIRIVLDLTLEDVYNGCHKEIKYNRLDKCDSCNGSGKTEHSREETCPHCGGTGQLFTQNGSWQQIRTCHYCGGKGTILTNPCKKCNGSGLVETTNIVEFDVPKGSDENFPIILNGMGNAPKNGSEYGDLQILLRVLPNERFVRRGNDLIFDLEVSVIDAILGHVARIKTIDGKEIAVSVPSGVEDGSNIRIKGRGLPIYGSSNAFGNLIGVVKIKIPKNVTESDKKLLNQLRKSDTFKI